MTNPNPHRSAAPTPEIAAPQKIVRQQSAPNTGRDFYETLKRSQLLAVSILSRLDPLLPPLLNAPAIQLAKTLVDQRAITVWQASEFLTGRNHIYLPGYKLLQPLPTESRDVKFVAEQLKQQRLVTITFTHTQDQEEIPSKRIATHSRLLEVVDRGNSGSLHWTVEHFFEGESLSTLMQHPEFQRGQSFEVAHQLFDSFCQENSPALPWKTLTAEHVLIDRHGEIKVRASQLQQPFDEQVFDEFVIFIDELFTSQSSVADEILTLLGTSRWHVDGNASTIETSSALARHARSLVECTTRPKLAHSRDYLRMFLRKSPRAQLIHPRNYRTWNDLFPDASVTETTDHDIQTNAVLSSQATELLEQDNTKTAQIKSLNKPRTRKGLPVKYLILLCAILFNSLSYFHPEQMVLRTSAMEMELNVERDEMHSEEHSRERKVAK